MRLSVGIEFLLSGALLILGLAGLTETFRPGLLLEPFRELLMTPQTRVHEGVAIAAGTAFLGVCYAVGVLVNVSSYDFLLRSRMQKILARVLKSNQEIMSRIRTLPHFSMGEDDLYGTLSSYLDTCAPEAVGRRRAFERSLQRLARGSLPGLLVLLFVGIVRVDWSYLVGNYRSDTGYLVISGLALTVLAVLIVLAGSSQVQHVRRSAIFDQDIRYP